MELGAVDVGRSVNAFSLSTGGLKGRVSSVSRGPLSTEQETGPQTLATTPGSHTGPERKLRAKT